MNGKTLKRLTGRASRVLAITGLAALGTVFGAGQVAQAAPSSTIVYSTDNGLTWSTDITAAPGAQIVTRVYYNNDTTDAITGTSVTTSIPAGFTLVPASMYASNTPDTTPTCAAGRADLTLSTSGLQTIDLLNNSYLNIHDCQSDFTL